jgi:NTE family protein
MQKKQRKKIGLALGSGGIRGVAHVGVIKTLIKHGIPIDYIAGTSIGACFGTLFALTKDIRILEDLALGYKRKKIMIFVEPTIKGGLIKGLKFERFLNNWFNNYTFKDLKIPTTLVSTDLKSGKSILLNSGKLTTAIRASSAIPSIFQPIKYNNYILVDGGLTNPVPADIVRRMGADIIIAVNLGNFRKTQKFKGHDISIKNISMRSINILYHFLSEHCTKEADFCIKPNVKELGFNGWKNYFIQKDTAENILKQGEKETEKIIPDILKKIND